MRDNDKRNNVNALVVDIMMKLEENDDSNEESKMRRLVMDTDASNSSYDDGSGVSKSTFRSLVAVLATIPRSDTQGERHTQTIVYNTQRSHLVRELLTVSQTQSNSSQFSFFPFLSLATHTLSPHLLRMRREASAIDRSWGLGRRHTTESSSLLFWGKIRRKVVQQGPSYDDSRRLYTHSLLHFQFHQSFIQFSSSWANQSSLLLRCDKVLCQGKRYC